MFTVSFNDFDRSRSGWRGVAVAMLVTGAVLRFSVLLQAQTAPSTYSAYTATDAKPIPPAPVLGPANSVINDPTFGSPILRVTDPNTNSGESFLPSDSGFHRTWNADSTAIKLEGPHGDGWWLEFNAGTFKVGDGSSHPAPHSLSIGQNWEWSTVDPSIIYFLNGNQIAKYNKATGVKSDIGGPSTGDPLAYAVVVIGQDNWVCAAAGAGSQDSYTKIYCVNPTSPGTSKFIDVYHKTINGVVQGDPNWPTSAAGQVIGIHDISGGTGSRWLEVTFHQASWGADGGAVLDLGTDTWTEITKGDNYWSGHVSMGNGTYANSSGSKDGRDSRGILLRDPDNAMNAAAYQFVAQPAVTNNNWCDGDHISWLNSMTNPKAPILVSRYYANVANCAVELTGEIYAAAVDGSGTIYRFAHNHDGGCYYSEGFAQISNDGNWALFSSYWDGKLGSDTAFGCQNRIDSFIIKLTPGDSSSGTTTSASGGTSSSGSTGGTSSSGTSGTTGSTSTGTTPDSNVSNGIALVQSAETEGAGTASVSTAFSSNNKAGDLIVAFVRMSTSSQTVSLKDSLGNTYTDAVSQLQTTDGHQVHLFYAKNIKAGANTVSASFSAMNNYPLLAVYEYSGVDTSSPLDQKAGVQGSGTIAAAGPSTTTSVANELVVAGIGVPSSFSGTIGAGAGYSLGLVGTHSRGGTETGILVSSQGVSSRFTLSSSTNWSMVFATFKAAVTGITTSSTSSSTSSTTSTTPPSSTPSSTGSTTTSNGTTATRPITMVQSQGAAGSGTALLAAKFAANNAAGDLIIAVIRMSTASQTVTLKDSAGNVYSEAVAQTQTADGHQVHVFYAKNIAGGANTITASFSGTNNYPWLGVYEYSGLSTSAPLDKTAHAQGYSATANSGMTGTTSSANELVFATVTLPSSSSLTVSPGSGYSMLPQNNSSSRAATEAVVVGSTGAFAGTFALSTSTNWTSVVATFRP